VVTFRHPRRPVLQGEDRVALRTVFSDPGNPLSDVTVVPIDIETGQPVQPKVDIRAVLHQQQKAQREALRRDFQRQINTARGTLERPWLDATPNARPAYQGATGPQFLSEFSPGPGFDDTTPIQQPLQTLTVGHQPSHGIDASTVAYQFAGSTTPANALPPGGYADWARTMHGEPTPTPAISQTLNSDITGSVYARAALDMIEMAKRQGYREAFVDMQVTRDSTAYAEFRAEMTTHGYTVNIQDICYKTNGPEYRVAITW
jgi:hypothetical protein